MASGQFRSRFAAKWVMTKLSVSRTFRRLASCIRDCAPGMGTVFSMFTLCQMLSTIGFCSAHNRPTRRIFYYAFFFFFFFFSLPNSLLSVLGNSGLVRSNDLLEIKRRRPGPQAWYKKFLICLFETLEYKLARRTLFHI